MTVTTDHYSVKAVEQHDQPPHWRIYFDVTSSDGIRVHCHAFPTSTFAWRAAEYGIDPSDIDTLLDVVLHEPHMTGHDHTSPDFLYNCDRTTARKALMARVESVKKAVSHSDPDGLLSAIRDAHTVDPADHASKTAYVDHVRTHNRAPAVSMHTKEPDRG